jgi:hypothetical protein
MPESKIGIANEEVSILKVCTALGMDIPDFALTAEKYKTWCPWGGIFHTDGGAAKAFMIYPATNTAHCFAGCGHFTPSKMKAMSMDISEEDAAALLLAEIGWLGEDLDARWEAAITKEEFVQTASLAEALKVYCARIEPQWESKQFEQQVASRLNQCLELLDNVSTSEQATRWLTVAKRVMAITLGVEQNEPQG